MKRSVFVTESGQQIPVEAAPGMRVFMSIPDDPVKEEVELDVDDEQFKEIQNLAMTNNIPADILKTRKRKHK